MTVPTLRPGIAIVARSIHDTETLERLRALARQRGYRVSDRYGCADSPLAWWNNGHTEADHLVLDFEGDWMWTVATDPRCDAITVLTADAVLAAESQQEASGLIALAYNAENRLWTALDTEGEVFVTPDRLTWTRVPHPGAPRKQEPNERPLGPHPSHELRGSDSSAYDVKCVQCHHTDRAPDGWGDLVKPCPKVWVGHNKAAQLAASEEERSDD